MKEAEFYFGLVKVGDIKPYHSDNTYLNEMNLTEQIESVDSVQSKSERYCDESVKILLNLMKQNIIIYLYLQRHKWKLICTESGK